VVQLEAGALDAILTPPLRDLDRLKGDPKYQGLLNNGSGAVTTIGMSVPKEPFGNKQVRQALAHALDYDGIISSLLGGAAVRPATAIPLPLTGSEEVLELAYQTDVAKAQELWDASGVGPQEIEIIYDNDTPAQGNVNYESLTTKVKSDLEQINGCTIKLSPMPGQQRIDLYRGKDFQMTISPWTPDYPDVDSYAGPFARTETAAAGRVGFSFPEIDAMLDQGLSEQDPAKRTEIYVQIQQKMIDECAFIVLYQPEDKKPASIKVQGVATHSVYQIQLRNASKTA